MPSSDDSWSGDSFGDASSEESSVLSAGSNEAASDQDSWTEACDQQAHSLAAYEDVLAATLRQLASLSCAMPYTLADPTCSPGRDVVAQIDSSSRLAQPPVMSDVGTSSQLAQPPVMSTGEAPRLSQSWAPRVQQPLRPFADGVPGSNHATQSPSTCFSASAVPADPVVAPSLGLPTASQSYHTASTAQHDRSAVQHLVPATRGRLEACWRRVSRRNCFEDFDGTSSPVVPFVDAMTRLLAEFQHSQDLDGYLYALGHLVGPARIAVRSRSHCLRVCELSWLLVSHWLLADFQQVS